MAGYYGHKAATQYTCVDRSLEQIPASGASTNGYLFYTVEAYCNHYISCSDIEKLYLCSVYQVTFYEIDTANHVIKSTDTTLDITLLTLLSNTYQYKQYNFKYLQICKTEVHSFMLQLPVILVIILYTICMFCISLVVPDSFSE